MIFGILIIGLLERMGIKTEVEGFLKDGDIFLEIKGERIGVLIGRHGETLESLQFLINRMINKKLKDHKRVVIDIDNYQKRRSERITKMAHRIGEKVKKTGHTVTIGPFNAHDRRIIHLACKEDPLLKTESIGEGEHKKVKIIPIRNEENRLRY